MIAKDLERKTLQLKPFDKIHLVEILLESMDEPNPEIEKAWVAESEARYTAYKAGKIKAVSLDGVQKRLKK